MNDPILDDLNPQQLEAVTAPDGALLIVAGAGTGKTRVITRRLAHLVRDRQIRPYEIFAATFTNKSAEEMKRRVADLAGGYCAPDFHISTFHSLCSRILRREASTLGLSPRFIICDERDQVSAIKQVMKRLEITEKEVKPGDVQDVINQCKMRMLGPEGVAQVSSSNLEDQYAEIYTAYEKYLHENSALDFEDLILRVVRAFREKPEILDFYQRRYRHVMVDEYQDTNAVQVELVSQLAASHRNLAVVGDEDQCIYSWRGADITNLLEFQKHFPEARLVKLEQNYRSTGNILKAAGAVISHNTERIGKTLFTDQGDGLPIYMFESPTQNGESFAVATAIEELVSRHGFTYADIAVFYRVSALSRVFEDRLREFRIPYRVVGGMRFYDRAEIKDLISYLQVIHNPGNSIALLRIINTPRRGLGDKTIQSVVDLARKQRAGEFEIMRRAAKDNLFAKGVAAKLAAIAAQFDDWQEAAETWKPSAVLQKVLDDTQYIASLGDPQAMDVAARTENIQELISSIKSFEQETPSASLQDYLENVSLVNAGDETMAGQSAISLMTLHGAKGLEFKAVFMVGMEETIFPSARSVMEHGNYEEERRLFYVGVTRAREILVLSRSQSRIWYGEVRWNNPSTFLKEIPNGIISQFDPEHIGLEVFEGEQEAIRDEAPKQHHEAATISRAVAATSRMLGQRVRHPLLGEGIITGTSGSGKSALLVFQLDDGQTYNLMAHHANLEVIAAP